MKTRKGSSRAEKPSNDEEDASSDENVMVTSKKSAKKSAKRRNVKLPLMELTIRKEKNYIKTKVAVFVGIRLQIDMESGRGQCSPRRIISYIWRDSKPNRRE